MLRRRAIERALRLSVYVQREKPEILFANLRASEFAVFYAVRVDRSRSFPPVVPVAHGVEAPGSHHARRRQMLMPSVAHVVAVSRGVSESIAIATKVPQEQLSVIYNPTDLLTIRQRAQEVPDHPWFDDEGPPVVLAAGRLVSVKDFPTLIEAFRRLLADRPYRLLVLGDGPMRGELEDQVSALGLEANVSLPGWVENPYSFMARASLFVLSSRQEALGNVLIEALACGCRAISTDCPGGPAEILQDPNLLVPVGDPDALARRMRQVLARPPDRAVQRAKAARFSAERTIAQYDELISRILAARKLEDPAGYGTTRSR